MEIDEALPDHLRCSRTDGRRWRCKKRVMDDKKYCEIHFLKIFSGKKSVVVSRRKICVKEEEEEEEEEEAAVPVPDYRRCSRTDGRKWRCSRRAMDNEKLCEIHHGRGKKGVSRKVSTEAGEAVTDLRRRPRCSTIGGQQWRCSERVMDDKKKPKISKKKGISWRLLMEEDKNLPDHLRCNRTDGRQWRCNRRVVENKKLCEIHHLQGRHRQYKQRVPESLKIQRKSRKPLHKPSEFRNFRLGAKKNGNWANLMKRRQWIAISEALDEALKKMKLKKGDLQLELIRMFLQRQVERQKQRNSEANCQGDLMRYLPNGLMAISPALSPLNFDNAGPSCEVKVGVDSGSFTRRCFRSKNIEPLPIGPLKVVPFAKNVANLRRVRRKNCHWCLKRGFQSLIKCSSCKKEHFCKGCIKERYLNSPEEVKVACPVCRGTCSCKACVANQSKNVDCKDLCKDDSKVFDI